MDEITLQEWRRRARKFWEENKDLRAELAALRKVVTQERDQARAEWAAAAQQVVNLTAELAELAEERDRLRAALEAIVPVIRAKINDEPPHQSWDWVYWRLTQALAAEQLNSTTPTPPPIAANEA